TPRSSFSEVCRVGIRPSQRHPHGWRCRFFPFPLPSQAALAAFTAAHRMEARSRDRYHTIREGERVKIILANPRGFCAGVNMAIESLERALDVYGTPLYV